MSEQNKALVRRFYDEVFSKGNLDRLDEFVSAEFVEHEEFPDLSPGREGVRQFVGAIREAFPDLRMEVNDLVAEGDRVAARVTMSGTQCAEFAGVPSSGKSFSVTAIDIIRLDNGVVVEHWGATDSASMMQQLGGGS